MNPGGSARGQDLLLLLQEVMSLSAPSIYIHDIEGRYLFANRSTEARFGAPPGSFVGRTREEVFPPGNPAIVEYRRNDLEVIRRRTALTFEETSEEADGTHTYLSVKYPLFDAAGAIYAVAGISTDITERKRLEVALREAETLLQSTLDALPHVAAHLARDGTILVSNRTARARRADAISNEVIGRNFRDILSPEIVGNRERAIEQALRTRTLVRTEDWAGGSCYETFMNPVTLGETGPERVVVFSRDITEQRQAESALREREARLSAILEAEPECVKTLDREGRLLSMNAAGLALLEADSFEAIRGAKLAERLQPPHRAAFDEMIAATFRGEARKLEFEMTSLRGRRLWLEANAVALHDSTDPSVVTSMLCVTRDITARKLALDALAQSRDDLARAETVALLGHYRLERGARTVTWSDGMYRIMGRSRESFVPTPEGVLETVHPDDRPLLLRHRGDLFAGLEPPPLALRLTRGDGQLIHVEGWSRPLRDDRGRVIGGFGAVQDVTARVRAEAAQKEEERSEQLRRSIADAPVAIAMFDRDMRYLSHSQRWLTEHGFAGRDLVGLSAYDVLGEVPERWRAANRRALAGEVIRADEDQWQRPDGTESWLSWEIHPWRDAAGEIGGVVIHTEDITARRRAEAEAERLQEQLHQAQKMEAVGRLTGGLAHDFNNLLAVIMGSLEIIEEEAVRGMPSEQELIEAAIRAGRRGQELVRRLLTFSRKMPLKAEPTNVDQLILDTLRLLQRTLGEAIEIDVSLNVGTCAALIDRGRFASALVNLALNARDAMPDGGRLTIATTRQRTSATGGRARQREVTEEEICICLGDTGLGMSEEVRRRAIEPFYTTKPDGTGLGLGLVSEFVEQSGGNMDIAGRAEGGTMVTIRLPLVPAPAPATESIAGDVPAATGNQRKILLVEDDSDVRAVTAARLKRLGYQVRAAADGNEAIAAIESPETIDVMLTDIVLRGGIDGISLVREALRVRPRMGMVCMSGYALMEKNVHWLRAQNVRLLEKPFTGVQLADALRELEM